MNEAYITVLSTASRDYFPDNSPHIFANKLQKPLNLDGNWVCALCDIQFIRPTSVSRNLWIECDFCSYSVIGGTECPLMRRVPLSGTQGQLTDMSFSNLYYIPVNRDYIETVQINIKDDSGEFPSFDNSPVICVFHLKRTHPPWF